VALSSKRCPKSGRDYLCCDYNRDGSSYRSPWSNTFDPPIEDPEEVIPAGRVRAMEEQLNAGVDVYRELYYEGGVSSAYLWELEDGFAGVVLFKKVVGEAGWDSIHVLEVQEAATKRKAHYKLTSTVILDLGGGKKREEGLELAGNLTRQQQAELQLQGITDEQILTSHVGNIGRLVEEMETKLRNLLQEVYFGKARDVVGDLRSLRSLREVEGERTQQREVMSKIGR
jgi:capping protein beta